MTTDVSADSNFSPYTPKRRNKPLMSGMPSKMASNFVSMNGVTNNPRSNGGALSYPLSRPHASSKFTRDNALDDNLEEEDEVDDLDWGEKQRNDPVGDCITRMLNEGNVPCFGYRDVHVEQDSEERFEWSPLLSLRNYRAIKRMFKRLVQMNSPAVIPRQSRKMPGIRQHVETNRESMWFMIETFLAIYIAIYSLNDLFLRSTLDSIVFLFFGVLSTIVDIGEVKSGILFLFHMCPQIIQKLALKIIHTTKESYATMESQILWGQRFQGRSLLWSDEKRILKFRWKHLRVMQVHNERRLNRRQRRKSRKERRRRERKGLSFDSCDFAKMEAEIAIKEALDDAAVELRRKPPTYFPSHLHLRKDALAMSVRSDSTKKHLRSIEYCHSMIFQPQLKHEDMKPVSITTNRQYSGMNALSPREAIEVMDEFPDIQVNAYVDDEEGSHAETASSSASKYSLHINYDLDSEDDNSHSDDDENNDDDDDDDVGAEDELSQVSCESELSIGKMNWIAVGAKIGTKILKSREVHRVISNPSRKLIPDEAKKLIGSIKTDQADDNSGSQLKSSTFDSHYSKTNELNIVSSDESKSTSTEAPIPKPPVHGMWTSAGSAAQYATSPYGAVTLPYSDSTPKHRGRKIFVSSAQESVELMRESSDGKMVDASDDSISGIVPVRSPYNLRLVMSMPTNGSITPTNATPKASNQAFATFTPPRNSISINHSDSTTRLAPIEKGCKIVVPLFAPNTSSGSTNSGFLQMGTVISSSRIFVSSEKAPKRQHHKWNLLGGHKEEDTNCLAIKLVLDRALLRGSKFATMNIRIMDGNFIPRFSKYPIGSCVATTFGIGVLVGWRVEDDMHIIRSLWNRSGPGSGLAYLRRECLHSVVEAAVGFDVETRLGSGRVAAYVKGGKQNTGGKYFVHLKSKGRYQDRVVEFKRNQILSCPVAKFVPVTEHIRAAALYQLEILHYKARVRERMLLSGPSSNERQRGTWRKFSEYVDLFAACLSKAIAEDPEFDQEVDKFINHIITILDDHKDSDERSVADDSQSAEESTVEADQSQAMNIQDWNIQDMFASFFAVEPKKAIQIEPDNELVLSQVEKFRGAHHSVSIILRVLLRTVAIAKATVPDRPKLHIALAMIHECLLFVRQVNRVQNKNISKALIEAWFKTVNEISLTFGPLKERFAVLGKKMAKKMKKHSDIAKKRVLSFVDIVLGDTQLLHSLERGEWRESLFRVEYALVKAKITDEATCEQLRKGVILLYKNLAPRKKDKMSKAAARRTEVKALRFAKLMKILAAPGRSVLRLLTSDDVLELFDRVLLRVFDHNADCAMMINIFAFSNFRSIRDMRTLNNMSIAGRLWVTILDACDEELAFVMSEIPENQKYFLDPFVKLFSLGVAKFHCIQSGRSNADWLDFLMEGDAVKIIQDIDMKLIDCLDSFCKDVKQLFEVMPYIQTIDNDILDLMDELDFDLMFKELTGSIGDPNKLATYITERSTILVERFLDYLPRMSIPIEKRELQDGWVLTCRGSDGGDLRLSDINVKRENLLCEVLGGDNVFRPLGKDGYIGSPKNVFPDPSFDSVVGDDDDEEDECVLDEIREIILSAQKHGCWIPGLGGLHKPFYYIGVPSQLEDLPLSESLKTGIDLWQSSAISGFEFTQIAIREVSNQIELHGSEDNISSSSKQDSPCSSPRNAFNPREDSTVLLLDIKNLTLHLDEFIFRVEKGEHKTIFDPVFEGAGSLTVKNVSISLRIEAKKGRVKKNGLWVQRPILQLASFDVRLEKLTILFKETGADWILNTVLKGFRDQITHVVQDNVKNQIMQQVRTALDHVNEIFATNHELLLTMLGITMDELESVNV